MTDRKKRSSEKSGFPALISVITIAILLCPTFLFPKEISDGVLSGIRLCVTNVIPSVFPFFIIADAISSLSDGLGKSAIGGLFSRVFHLPREALNAFLCGCICGFPLGVKIASDLYERGAITKKECEHLIGFSNNPSVAFVTGAVGLGMLGSFRAGVAIYITVLVSAVITGLFFRNKQRDFEECGFIAGQKFDFVSSVKNAGFASVGVSSYIIFFSALSALTVKLLGSGLISAAVLMLSEVSGACKFISRCTSLGRRSAASLICAALSFSGFSVHLQAKGLASKEISFIKYYIMKSVQSLISGILAYITFGFFPI